MFLQSAFNTLETSRDEELMKRIFSDTNELQLLKPSQLEVFGDYKQQVCLLILIASGVRERRVACLNNRLCLVKEEY